MEDKDKEKKQGAVYTSTSTEDVLGPPPKEVIDYLIEKGLPPVKASLHLESQKFGKQPGSAQRSLFDYLNGEQKELAREENIETTGIDLSMTQNRAVNAIQSLFTVTGYKGSGPEEIFDGRGPSKFKGSLPTLKVTPTQYLEAYGVKKQKTGRGKMEYRSNERKEAIKALEELASKSRLIWYTRKYLEETKRGAKEERSEVIKVITPLIQLGMRYQNLTEGEVEQVKQGGSRKLSHLLIKPFPIFVDQIDKYFILKGARYLEEIKQIAPRSKILYRLVDFLLLQAELKRRHKDNYTVEINYIKLAHKLRMNAWINTRNWKQIRESLNSHYDHAKQLGYLNSYKIDEPGVYEEKDILFLNPDKCLEVRKREEK